MKTTFIYALCEPGTRTVRYIGYSNNPRKRLRTHKCRNTPAGRWLRNLGANPELVVLKEVPIEDRKLEEARYIRGARVLGLGILNENEGGGGPSHHTPETCAKIRVATGGINNPNFGLSPSEETRQKMRLARLGKTMPPETRAKISARISEIKTGRKLSPSHCASIGASKRGRVASEETRKRMSVSQQVAWRARKQVEDVF